MEAATGRAGVSITFIQIKAQTKKQYDLGEVVVEQTLQILEFGSWDRVKILQRYVS